MDAALARATFATTVIALKGGPMTYKCGLCMISASKDAPVGTKQEIVTHIKNHGTDDIELYLMEATEQTTLC